MAMPKATASSSSIPCGASPPPSGWRATRPSPSATTSPATIACAASSTPSGSAPTATSHRRLGLSGPASRRRPEANPDRLAGDRRARQARRSIARRKDRDRGQQPVDHPHRGPGHAARFRQRPLGPAPADPVGPGADADRLPSRRRLSYRRFGLDSGRHISWHRWLAHARDRGPCRRPKMAVRRARVRRRPALCPRLQLVLTPPTPNLVDPQRGRTLDRS